MVRIKLILVAVLIAMINLSGIAQNSVPNTPEEKRQAFLTPQYYTNWLGASFLTIPTVEKEFAVEPVQIVDLTFFYDFGDCFVGMESNEKGVVVQMTLRLFGDRATNFIQQAIDYGFEFVGNGEDITVRSNTGKLLPEITNDPVKRYRKKTQNGNVYLEVSNGSRSHNEYEIAVYRAKD